MERPQELTGTFWPMVKSEDACCQFQVKSLNSVELTPIVSSPVTVTTIVSEADRPLVVRGIRRTPPARMGSGTFQPVG